MLKLSAGHIDITPTKPMPLFGFASRKQSFVKVHDTLEVNLKALKFGDRLVLLYSVDTLFVPTSIEEEILKQFGNQYRLSKADIWLMASHTHFAPSLDKSKPKLGAFDEDYYEFVLSRIFSLTKQVLGADFEEVSIAYGKTKSVLNVNRRKKLLRPWGKFGLRRKTLIYPDHDGDKDDTIQVVKFMNKDKQVKAMLWNFACHPVGFVNRTEVSADFIGLARLAMREQMDNEQLPIVFAIGFAGDLKPDVTSVTKTKWIDRLGYFFQYKPKYTKFPNLNYYNQWVEKLIDELQSVNTSKQEDATLNTSHTAIDLSEVIGATDKVLHFKKLSFNNDLHFIGISAEVLVGFKKLVNEVVSSNTVNIGCLAGTDIYLPTNKNVKEGGYEVEIFKDMFGIEGQFKHNIDEVVHKALSSL